MRSLQFRIVLVLTTMIIAAGVAAQEVQYVNLTPGALNIFHNQIHPNFELRRWVTQETEDYSVVRWDRYNDGVFFDIQKETWRSIDEGGDVWCHFYDGNACTPAYKAVDAPLAVGNTWETSTQYGGYGELHLSYECTGFEEVTVAAGTFECYVVRCDWFIEDLISGTDIHYYCEGVGEVKWEDGGTVYELRESRTLEYMNLDTSLPKRTFENRQDLGMTLFEWAEEGADEYLNVRMDYREDGNPLHNHTYHYTSDDEGDVWSHGRNNEMYDPAYRLVDAPLFVGKSWEATTEFIGYELHYAFVCLAEEDVTVPAGIFHCFVVEMTLSSGNYEGTMTSWYCEGIGRVKSITSSLDWAAIPDGEWDLENPVVPVAEDLPAVTLLAQNYPNPFNPMTTIAYTLRADGPVTLTVYDLAGRRVRRLVDGGRQIAGEHRVVWDGRNDAEAEMPSGAYFYRLVADGLEVSRTMTLVR